VRDAGAGLDRRGHAALSLEVTGAPAEPLAVLALAAEEVRARDRGCNAIEAARRMAIGQGDGSMVRELMASAPGSPCSVPLIRLLQRARCAGGTGGIGRPGPQWATSFYDGGLP
jgi:hypothetical protein